MDANISRQIAEYQQSGDIALRNELVLRCMGLVRSIVLSMRNMYIKYAEADDVVNEGVLALMDALDSFDPAKGAKFETYATLRIRGAVVDYIRKQDWIPRNVRKFARALDNANSKLYNLYNRPPTTAELAQSMDISEDKLLRYMADAACSVTLSFEELLYEDNFDEAGKTAPTDHELMQQEMRRTVAQAVEALKENERQVITLYYYKNMKYSDIAKALGVSESRVCQIHAKAALTLKAALTPYVKGEDA